MSLAPRRALASKGWLSLFAGLWLASPSLVAAHDLWLEADPASTAPAKPEERGLHLRMGEKFVPEEEKALQKDRLSRFDLYVENTNRRDLLAQGQAGQVPVAKIPSVPGSSLVVMDLKEKEIAVDHEKFNRYLADEGQESILTQRARSGQTDTDGKEVYTRFLKALIPGTDPGSTLPNTFYKRRVGQRLEILLQNNPNQLPINRKLTVKVLFEGKPLAGAKIFACPHPPSTSASTQAAGMLQTITTSAQGLAEFRLDQNGPWLVRLVHVRASPDRKTNLGGPWESFWGSYTFVARGNTPANSPPVSSPSPGRSVVDRTSDERKK